MLNGMTTRSPLRRLLIAGPTSSTMPIGSWPRMSPSVMNGPSTSYRCRSEPQIPLDVTRMIASLGSWIAGSGTRSTRTSRRPCQVTAFMSLPPLRAATQTGGSAPIRWPTRRVRGETRQLGEGPGASVWQMGCDGEGDGHGMSDPLGEGVGPCRPDVDSTPPTDARAPASYPFIPTHRKGTLGPWTLTGGTC